MSINWYKSPQAPQPTMTLSSNGNLSIGTLAPNMKPSITLGEYEITEDMIKELQKTAGFLEYIRKTDPAMQELWTAFEAAEKLKDNT